MMDTTQIMLPEGMLNVEVYNLHLPIFVREKDPIIIKTLYRLIILHK